MWHAKAFASLHAFLVSPEKGYTLSDDSETDEGDDEDMQAAEDDYEVASLVTDSRPFMPLPSYPPAGPALLHSYFQHNLLLGQSTPLRPLRTALSLRANLWCRPGIGAHACVTCRAAQCSIRKVKIAGGSGSDPREGGHRVCGMERRVVHERYVDPP